MGQLNEIEYYFDESPYALDIYECLALFNFAEKMGWDYKFRPVRMGGDDSDDEKMRNLSEDFKGGHTEE